MAPLRVWQSLEASDTLHFSSIKGLTGNDQASLDGKHIGPDLNVGMCVCVCVCVCVSLCVCVCVCVHLDN